MDGICCRSKRRSKIFEELAIVEKEDRWEISNWNEDFAMLEKGCDSRVGVDAWVGVVVWADVVAASDSTYFL